MSNPKRLLESSPNPRTRELLRAGLTDAPDPGTLPRLVAAAGSLATLGASSSAAGSAFTAGLGGLGKAGTASFAIHWVGIGLVAGLVTGGGIAVMSLRANDGSPATPAAAVSSSRATAPPAAASAAGEPAERDEAVAAAREPMAIPQGRDTGIGARQAPAQDAPGALDHASQLAADVALIDRAKKSLGRGDAAATLRELEAYGKSRNTGVLDREALVLKVEALVLEGKRSQASEVARGYLERFPEDAYTRRLRQLVAPDR